MTPLTSLLSQLAFAVPLFVAYAVGITLAQRHRERYPRMARRVVTAVVVDVIAILFGAIATTIITLQREPMGLTFGTVSTLFMAIGVVRTILHTLAVAFLLAAAVAERGLDVPAAAAGEASLAEAELRYDQVPWYRQRWFVVITFLFFMPATLVIALSGEVYANRDGRAQKLTPSQRYGIVIAVVVLMALALIRAVVAARTLE